MSVYKEVESRMCALADEAEAKKLMRFFKTGKGEYGEGDVFLGIKVPVTRSIVREYRQNADMEDVEMLTASAWHEIRLAGFLLLIEIYKAFKKRKDADGCRRVVDLYISLIPKGNNWDLVDLVAPKILGDWLVDNPACRHILYQFATMHGCLWHQRVAIVANWTIIRSGDFDDTFKIASIFLDHKHDLIHKASGWMLREVGKRGGKTELLAFLDKNAPKMPRTMLRYAIEKLEMEERKHYLSLF